LQRNGRQGVFLVRPRAQQNSSNDHEHVDMMIYLKINIQKSRIFQTLCVLHNDEIHKYAIRQTPVNHKLTFCSIDFSRFV